MARLFNLARMTTATTGTGTITLGSAVSGYLTFALAGVADGDTVSYGIKDGSNSEVGTGVYTASGTTLTRNITKSTNSDAAISLSGTAEVFITARAEDIFNKADPLTSSQVAAKSDQETASSTTLAVSPGRQQSHPSAAKAWVNLVGSTAAINTSYNVASATRNGTGDYTITFSTAFASANYVTTATSLGSTGYIANPRAQTTTTVQIFTFNNAGAVQDPTSLMVACFGTQ